MLALAWGHWAPWPYIGQLSIRHNTATRHIHYNTHRVSSSSTQHVHQQSGDTCRTQIGDTYTYILDQQIIKMGGDVTMTVSIFLFVLRDIS